MPARVLKRRIEDIFRDAQTYLHTRAEASVHTKKFESAKAPLKKWLKENGIEDADGNLVYEFPRDISSIDEKVYAGVMLRKSVGQSFMVEDEVREFIKRHKKAKVRDAYGRVFKYVEVLDQDELYVLQQEGAITEEELRSLLKDPAPQYALWPIEATEELEGDDA